MIDFRNNMGKYVSVTYRHIIVYMSRKMEPLQIGAGQYAYLFALYVEDGQSQQSLTDRMLVDKAATVRAINKLEKWATWKEGLIPIRPQLESIVDEIQEILLENMSTEEKIILKRLMQQMAGNIIKVVR
ncbi:MAG: MarR family winged helix-turn-helix transcriptional regulator [Thermincolia bacterium]